jgi:hypothetical protein
VALDRRRRRLARAHRIDPLDLPAADQRDHLTRQIGLDVLAVAREPDMERAAAGREAPEDVRARDLGPPHPGDLAEREDRPGGAGVIETGLAHDVPQLRELALEQPDDRAAGAGPRARRDDVDVDGLRLQRAELRRGEVGRLHDDPPRDLRREGVDHERGLPGGRRRERELRGRDTAPMAVEPDDCGLPGDHRLEDDPDAPLASGEGRRATAADGHLLGGDAQLRRDRSGRGLGGRGGGHRRQNRAGDESESD